MVPTQGIFERVCGAGRASFQQAALCGKIETGLCNLSKALWKIYLTKITAGGNRLTRSIQKFASDYGFAMYTQDKHVVYIGQLSDSIFLGSDRLDGIARATLGIEKDEKIESYKLLKGQQTGLANLYETKKPERLRKACLKAN
jgi:hypothetical protein